MNETTSISEQLEFIVNNGRRDLLPLLCEIGSLESDVASRERSLKGMLQRIADDATRAIGYLEEGYSFDVPSSEFARERAVELQERKRQLDSLTRIANHMIGEED